MQKNYLIALGLAVATTAALVLGIGLKLISDMTQFIQAFTILIVTLIIATFTFFVRGFYRGRNTTKSNKESKTFIAVIDEKKLKYEVGQLVHFKSRYTGNVVNGFFSNEIFPPKGTIFPNGKRSIWFPDRDSIESPKLAGKLNGFVDAQSIPMWAIGLDYNFPRGIYRVEMGLYNQFSVGEKRMQKPLKQMKDTFEVA